MSTALLTIEFSDNQHKSFSLYLCKAYSWLLLLYSSIVLAICLYQFAEIDFIYFLHLNPPLLCSLDLWLIPGSRNLNHNLLNICF